MTSGNNSLNPQRNRKGVPRKALNNTDVRFSSKWMVKAGAFAEMLMAAFSSCVPVPTCMHIRACVCVRPPTHRHGCLKACIFHVVAHWAFIAVLTPTSCLLPCIHMPHTQLLSFSAVGIHCHGFSRTPTFTEEVVYVKIQESSF